MKAKETLQARMDCRPLTSGVVSDPKPAALRCSALPFRNEDVYNSQDMEAT